MQSERRGFTLIELLVVIAIIAILAAILFPIFLTAKRKGQEASCQSNLRQIGIAFQLYADSWQDCYPDQTSLGHPYHDPLNHAHWIVDFAHRYKDVDGNPAGMGLVLRPYLKNLAVFKCPSEWRDNRWPDDAIKAEPGYNSLAPEPGSRPGLLGYLGYNTRSTYYYKFALMHWADTYAHPVRAIEIQYRSKAALLFEQAWHNTKDRPFLWDVYYWNQKAATRDPEMRVNVLFIDLHAGHIYIPYTASAGYDGNWYNYSGDGKQWGRFWDLSKGARDIP